MQNSGNENCEMKIFKYKVVLYILASDHSLARNALLSTPSIWESHKPTRNQNYIA